MKKEDIMKLVEKMGLNKPAWENLIKEDIKIAEEQIKTASKHMGIK